MSTTNYIWAFENDSYLMEKDDTAATISSYTSMPVRYGRLISFRQSNGTGYYHVEGKFGDTHLKIWGNKSRGQI